MTGARVSYLSKGFRVEGLPESIRLKKPRQYGSNELKKIMNNKDEIKFIIEPNAKEELPISTENKECDELLEKVFERKNFSLKKVSLQEVQALEREKFSNISLIEELLTSCANLFSNDALTTFTGKFNEFVASSKELILPVYCSGEEDNFWLFYCSDSAENLKRKCAKDKLTGYWLDHESATTYKMLQEKVTLIGENIIKQDGRYIFEVHKFEDMNQTFELNKSFEKKINKVLSEQGYI